MVSLFFGSDCRRRWGVRRLTLFIGIGTVVAPVLGSYVFFKDLDDDAADNMQNVQWTYLAIAIFVFILAVVFYLSPIPEITVC